MYIVSGSEVAYITVKSDSLFVRLSLWNSSPDRSLFHPSICDCKDNNFDPLCSSGFNIADLLNPSIDSDFSLFVLARLSAIPSILEACTLFRLVDSLSLSGSPNIDTLLFLRFYSFLRQSCEFVFPPRFPACYHLLLYLVYLYQVLLWTFYPSSSVPLHLSKLALFLISIWNRTYHPLPNRIDYQIEYEIVGSHILCP